MGGGGGRWLVGSRVGVTAETCFVTTCVCTHRQSCCLCGCCRRHFYRIDNYSLPASITPSPGPTTTTTTTASTTSDFWVLSVYFEKDPPVACELSHLLTRLLIDWLKRKVSPTGNDFFGRLLVFHNHHQHLTHNATLSSIVPSSWQRDSSSKDIAVTTVNSRDQKLDRNGFFVS